MPLEPGARVGVYEIAGLIGSGGMGEVYRARDPRLGRDVAVKVLPEGLAEDAGRLARFEQEARAAAALNHPNILAVYDIGQFTPIGSGQASPYIVSELLDGDTLRERSRPATASGAAPLPVRKAVDYAIQIAHGLAAAHDKGIVHRDLKPENVFVTADGRIKILDFGLAKLTHTESAEAAEAPTRSETDLGAVLGTVGYMSPEQVRGQAADHRSDIFAFGVVLYEMLSGRRAFRRDSLVETMTAILRDDAPDLPMTERRIPPALVRIVDRCLEKMPAARFQSTHDLAFALEALFSSSGAKQAVEVQTLALSRGRTRGRLAWALTAVLALGLLVALVVGAVGYFGRAPGTVATTRFFVSPPEGWVLALQVQGGPAVGPLAVSPDGRHVAFVAQQASGRLLIWVRSLDTLEAKGLVGTEGGSSPFWSPDGRSLGFFADGKLKKIDVAGGPPVTLCDASPGISGAWSPEGVIVFSPAGATALQQVSAAGGVPSPATELAQGEAGHSRPSFLPDGRHFLYRAGGGNVRAAAYLGVLDSTDRIRLVEADSTNIVYSQRHLLFLRGDTLMAQPFDPDRLVTTGDAFTVADHIQRLGNPPFGFFSASDSGVLAYQTGSEAATPHLTWFDRAGQTLGTVGDPALYGGLRLSPDGNKASVSLAGDIWLVDLARHGLATRFTFDPVNNEAAPIWSPDGSQVVFTSNRRGVADLYRKASSMSGNEEVALIDNLNKLATSWSPDERFILYQAGAPPDIWALPLASGQKPFPVLQTPAAETEGMFSPDGRWIAYVSNESVRGEVYVMPFDDTGDISGGRWRVSTAGGNFPRWRADGKELFYVSPHPGNILMAAAVSGEGKIFQVAAVEALFQIGLPGTPRSFYDVSGDGRRFLVNMAPQLEATPITVVMNWMAK